MNGLALSGGGMKGFAHLGAIKALNDLGVRIDIISGSSVGAIVGALIAKGYEPKELLKFNKDFSLLKILSIRNPLRGISTMDKLKESLKPYLGNTLFSDLRIKLIVNVTNLLNGRAEQITKGSVINAVIASSSIPGIFKPVRINNKLFIDGEVTSPTPIKALKNNCDKIISITLEHLKPIMNKNNIINVVSRATRIMRAQLVRLEEEYASIALRIPTYNFNSLTTKQSVRLYNMGYKTVMNNKQAIKKVFK